jgi:hypothetical protein
MAGQQQRHIKKNYSVTFGLGMHESGRSNKLVQ